MNRFLPYVVFLAGLAALAWVGQGYVGANPLALTITALIGAFYLMGALELHRFRQATSALAQAVAAMPDPLADLRSWLVGVPPALQNAVRRRIEGEQVGFPGPAMAPYLAGLLVLLGMLGTFLGMVLTLRGTGMALDSATDLQAVRTSLVAPVKGLGLAFGTSIAGIATSAALGFMSALCRVERVQAAQRLDGRIATTLRVFSVAHHREESLKLLQRQAECMPALVDSLRAMMEAMERQARESTARQQASQAGFHGKIESAVAGLAASVDRSLKESLAESARIAGATIAPAVEATLAGIARETVSLHESLAGTAQRQVEQLSTRFETITNRVAQSWETALARHERTSQGLSENLHAALDRSALTFEQRSTTLLDSVARRQSEWQDGMATTMAGLASRAAAVQESIAASVTMQLDGVSGRLDGTVQRVTATWEELAIRHERVGAEASRQTEYALRSAAGAFEQHSAALLRTVGEAHADLQSTSAARDALRMTAMTQSLEAMAATLRDEWQQAGAQTLAQQQRICETMERTARDSAARAEAHAGSTAAEIGQLLQAASEAPRAAAAVIAELRQKLSDSMARDNTLLEERARILETLGTLLEGVNQAASEQRGAIDALVASSAALLDRVGNRFIDQVEAQTGKLAAVAAQVTGSAVEVASLGEAFGFAVQLFGESNDKLVAQLQRIDSALGKSLSRSDEQLAYYVAQAREVVDLSILSQKQIIEDLQRIGGKAPAVAVAAP